jgi:hypothetical protein
MPAEHVGLLAVDQVSHCSNPLRALRCFQSTVLCILNNLEDVTAFESVAIEAYAALDLLELAASFAFFGR